jgi:4-amino-4-deoxy-L-arabinose transferase-like glycosyltransferase
MPAHIVSVPGTALRSRRGIFSAAIPILLPVSASDRSSRALLLIAIAVGAALRFRGLQFGFPNPVARVDEEVLVDAALSVLRDGNPHFFDWPSLFIYVTAAGYAVLFAVERAIGGAIRHATIAKGAFQPALHLVPRALSATAGVLTIVALYGAARELFVRRVALVAAALLAVAFLHVRDSHFGVTDVPATFLTVCALWAAFRCAALGTSDRRAAIAGLLCGLATTTKYNTALTLLPAVIAIAQSAASSSPPSFGRVGRHLALLLACAAAGFLVGTPFALLDHEQFLRSIAAVGSHLGGGHVVMERGWGYHAMYTLPYGVGIPLMIAAAAGACWLVVERRREAALVLAFPVVYYIVLGSGHTVFVRYLVPLVPSMCLTAAFFIDRVAAVVESRSDSRAVSIVMVASLVAVVGVPTLVASLRFDRLMARADTRVLGADWVASHFPGGASMYQTGFGAGHLQPQPRSLYPQYALNDRTGQFELDHRSAAGPPALIVILESPLGAYSEVPQRIRSLAADEYEPAATFESLPDDRAARAFYDREDAFFSPFGGIEQAIRPGPNVRIFERRRSP